MDVPWSPIAPVKTTLNPVPLPALSEAHICVCPLTGVAPPAAPLASARDAEVAMPPSMMTAIVRVMMRLLSIRPPFVFQLAPPIGEHSGDCYMFRGEVPLPGGRYS